MAAPNRILHPKLTFQPFNSWVNAKTTQGLAGNGRRVTDCSITNGSAILTSTSTIFVSGDAGKYINVTGAGVAGADLVTTILSYQSSGQVTLNLAASTSVSNANTVYGTDDTAGLQTAINAFASGTLYLPSGTYLITSELQYSGKLYANWLGQHPSTTILLWGGTSGGNIVRFNGTSYSRFGRMTYDGNGKTLSCLSHKWDGSIGQFVTNMRHEDEVYNNTQIGIRGGTNNMGDAECAMLRCYFNQCTIAGISIESFNAVDWYIWHNEFHGCYDAITNNPNGIGGAGNFYVYENFFENSTHADISTYNTEFFGFKRNYSIGSKKFYINTQVGFDGAMTFQDNIILDTTDDIAIDTVSGGPFLMIDNIIRSRIGASPSNPAVRIAGGFYLASIGNVFTVPSPIQCTGKVITHKDTVFNATQRGYINPVLPTYWDVLPTSNYPVIEIDNTVGDCTAQLQTAINSLPTYRGQNPIIHLPKGQTTITSTLSVPDNNLDFQIIGDGYASRFTFGASSTGGVPMLTILSGDTVVLHNFRMDGNPGGANLNPCLSIKCTDVKGKNIFLENVSVTNAINTGNVGLLVENFVNSLVECHAFGNGPCYYGVRANNADVRIFSGASSDNNFSYDVTNGGKIMVQNVWYESATKTGFFTPTGDGEFIINSCKVSSSAATDNCFVLDGTHNVKTVIAATFLKCRIAFSGSNANNNLLSIANDPISDPTLVDTSTGGKARHYLSRDFNDLGAMDVPFVASMLDPIRTRKSVYKTQDIGFFMDRVLIQLSQTPLHIQSK